MGNGYSTVDVNGVCLAYRVWGEPGAPAVVLLHGIGGGGPGDWDTVAEGLADRWRVYALDQRGHGHSDRLSDRPGERPGDRPSERLGERLGDRPGGGGVDYSIESLVADVQGVAGALGLTQTVVIGHSLGGLVAYLFAARHPQLVRALVVEDAGLLYPREPVEVRRPDGEPAFDWAAVMALRGQIDEPDPRWREQARGITVPTLLVSGGPSSYVRGETITRWAEALPRAEVVTIDAGHMVHQQRPAEFVAVVREFLGRV